MNQAVFVTAMLIALFSPRLVALDTLSICIEVEPNPPWVNSPDKINSDNPGTLIKIIRNAAKQINVNVTFIHRPWLRCQKLVQQGKVHGLTAMIYTEERSKLFQFPANLEHYIAKGEYPIFYNKQTKQQDYFEHLASGQDNSDKKLKFGIGAPLGYVVADQLQDLGVLAQVNYSLIPALTMISQKRLDGYSVEREIGKHQIKKLGLSHTIAATTNNLSTDRWYVAFNKSTYQNNKLLIDHFWSQQNN